MSGGTVTADSNITFTPGVNGDYAYPQTFFSLVDASQSASNVTFGRSVAQATFTDKASNSTGVLEAKSNIVIPISVPIPGDLEDTGIATILRGFRLDMECDPALQPEGDVCNSNGIWASFLAVNITNCQVTSKSYDCEAQFVMERGCNPGCNSPIAPKPFNYVMSYQLYIFYTSVVGAVVTPHRITEAQNTDFGIVFTNTSTTGRSGFQDATVAITGFSYDLKEFDGIVNLGRYLERLAFNVQDIKYDSSTAVASYSAALGYYTPITTAPAHGIYQLDTALLQFGESIVATEPLASPVNGTVCISDELFHCELNIDGIHLSETTNDIVPISVTLY